MKKTLLATTILAATAFAANAASTSFNGAYLGAQAGYVKSKVKADYGEHIKNFLRAADIATKKSASSNGFAFGTYFGYGHNINGFYIGAEMSILGDNSTRKINTIDYVNNAGDTYKQNFKYKRGIAFGLAPRMGFVFGENLIYVKPGIEISKDSLTTDTFEPNGATSDKTSKTVAVFAPAIGYERAMGKILFRAEYTYNAGKKWNICTDNAVITELAKVSYSDNRFVIGAAYKF